MFNLNDARGTKLKKMVFFVQTVHHTVHKTKFCVECGFVRNASLYYTHLIKLFIEFYYILVMKNKINPLKAGKIYFFDGI